MQSIHHPFHEHPEQSDETSTHLRLNPMLRPPQIALLESYGGRACAVMAQPDPGRFASHAAERYGDPIHAGEISGEIVAASEQGYAKAAAWVADLFDHPNSLQDEDWPEVQRARALSECDAVLLCTSDIPGLNPMIGRVQRLAPGAAVFTVCEMVTPSQKAMVLNWGADDVLDIGMAAREGAARIRAVCRRIAQTRAARKPN